MPEEKTLKSHAEEIFVAVDKDLQTVEADESEEVAQKTNFLMRKLFGIIDDVDVKVAHKRVEALRKKYPRNTQEELAQRLIRSKCQRTGAVGAVTSGAGLIPGIGTAAAMTLGVATDIGSTFKLQAELVLELASVYGYSLTEEEKQRIVLLITGLSAGTNALARKTGQAAAIKVGEKLAERTAGKAFLKSLPVLGVLASAGTNVLSTYMIGRRADAYFRLGPDSLDSWQDSLRTITGVDERKVGSWMVKSGKTAGGVVVGGAGKAAGAARTGAVASGRGVLWVIGFLWGVISFVPRKIFGWFRGKKKNADVSSSSENGRSPEEQK